MTIIICAFFLIVAASLVEAFGDVIVSGGRNKGG
jgi:hypothetical protein